MYCVGGCVRDRLLGLTPKDIDVAGAGAVELAREFAARHHAHFVLLHDEHGCARVIRRDRAEQLDFAELREADLEQDLRLRDFTINAVACRVADWFEPSPAWVDPTGGRADLAARRLRACGPDSLPDDPLRVLRAHRFAALHGLTIEADTLAAMTACAPRLVEVAGERVGVEWFALLSHHGCLSELPRMQAVGSLGALFPELPDDAVAQVLALEAPLAPFRTWFGAWLAEPQRLALLRCAALLGPRDDGVLEDGWLARFALSRRQQQALRCFRLTFPQCDGPWRAQWAERLLAHGELIVGAWLLAAARGEQPADLWEPALQVLVESAWPAWQARPWVTGGDLRRLGYQPGEQYGRALAAARLAQVAGDAADAQAALNVAREVMEHDGRLD